MNRRLRVAAELSSLPEIHRFAIESAEAAGLEEIAAYRLRLSVEELTTNVIEHGGESPLSKPAASIELFSEINDESLRLQIVDDGPPFDPTQNPPPDDMHLPAEQRQIGGLGVFLAIDGVDEFHYVFSGGRNCVTLVIHRPPPMPS